MQLERFYEKDVQFNKIISGFSLLSIILSVIGLFGITAFSIKQRLKEVSIRKVLGATLKEIILLFNSQLIRIFGLSLMVAMPVSYYLIDRWLENFAYHIHHSFVFYLFTGLSILFIITATVTFTTLKAATSNPANYLRDQ